MTSKSSNEEIRLAQMFGESNSNLLLQSCVNYSLDQTSGLKNGDTITLHWDCDDDLAKVQFNCKLSYSDIEYTVSELTPVNTFNPFDYVDVSFSGTSPSGSISITPNYDQSEMQYISFSVDKSSGLKNGETVTVNAYISGNENNFIEKFGSVLGETEKTYTVDNLSHYAENIDEIPSELIDQMEKQGEDVFYADKASNWSSDEILYSLSYIGNYFVKLKEGFSEDSKNYIYLVYKVTISNPAVEEPFDYYFYIRYSNIVIQPDNTCTIDISSYSSPIPTSWLSSSYTKFTTGRYYYYGYQTLEGFENDCIIAKIENYEFTSNISE
jgi:hypothetical protein